MSNFNDEVIAGALFDFLGFMTTREESTPLGATELATPAVDLLAQWANTRGLKIDEARVSDWQAALSQQEAEQHSDDVAVDLFATAMKNKMALSREKGRSGWDDPLECYASELASMLVAHVEKGDPVDIANFCMMIHQRGIHGHEISTAFSDALIKAHPIEPSPQGLEEFIHKHWCEFDTAKNERYILVDDLRTYMAGKALVPVEPTREMIARTVDAVFDGAIEDENIISEIYSAMITASKEGV